MMRTNKKSIIALISASVLVCLVAYLVVSLFQQQQSKLNRARCQSNLRQIGQAIQMYVADNNGLLPMSTAWYARQIPSLPKKGCPIAEPVPSLSPPLRDTERGLPGYAFNTMLAASGFRGGIRSRTSLAYADLAHPATTLAVFDYTSGTPSTDVLNPYGEAHGGWPKALAQGWTRHGGGGNYLFCDGHVGWFVESAILKTEPDICDGDKTRPNFCVK